MRQPNEREPSMEGGVVPRARFPGAVLDWSSADKCLLIAVWVLAGVVWYGLLTIYLCRHPEIAPYVDPSATARALRIVVAPMLGCWLAIAAAALALRRRSPENRVLVHATLISTAITLSVWSYCLGHYTNLFTGTVFVGASAVGLVLFDRAATFPAIALALTIFVATTVAEQLGVIPYGPLLAAAPYDHGRLSGWWLVGFGGVTFAILLLYIPILYEMVERWRDREARLAATSEQLSRANDIISRYVASQLAEQIRAGTYDGMEKHSRQKLTVFFSDIKDFSDIADHVEPEDLSERLNEYLSEMAQVGERFGATIDKFVGDAIMIFFGAPIPMDDRSGALRAVEMAIAMQERMGALREKCLAHALGQPFEMRIGINTGHATVGNFGSKHRMDYTAIGRQVNLAARLESCCEPGKILIAYSTWVLVQDQIACVPKGNLQVKGFRDPLAVYEVTGRVGTDRARDHDGEALV